jgi:hypothetical protein
MASTLQVNEIKHTGGTTALTIDSSGRLLTPTLPYIHAQGLTDGNVTVANNTAINFTLSRTSAFSRGITLANNTDFTVPIDGIYFFTASVYFSDSNTSCRIQLTHNGSYNNPHGGLTQSGAGASRSISITQLLELEANDYIQVYNASGSNRSTYNGNNHTFASMYLVSG